MILRRIVIALATMSGLTLLCLLVLHRASSISTEIWINSSPQRVWQVLTATADYPAWNPMISRLTGDLREGNVIEFSEGADAGAMTFHPRVLRVREAQELRWKGSVLVPGLFDGEHRFLLEEKGNETHLVQSEKFTGLLVGRLTQSIVSDTTEQMKAMNAALKQRCESNSAQTRPTSP